MPMKVVKKTKEHIIYERGDKRYAVKTAEGKKAVNGDDKIAILVAEGLLKVAVPQKKEEPAPEAAEEAPAAEAAVEETPAEEAPAEDAGEAAAE